MGSFYRRLAASFRLLRFDRPGTGLADRDVYDFTLERQLEYLQTVIVASGEEQVALLGRSFSGPLAIAYAVAHPERVSHLVLFGSAPRFVSAPDYPEGLSQALVDAVAKLVAAEWGLGSRTAADIMLPGLREDQLSWYSQYQLSSSSAEVAVEIIAQHTRWDVRNLLPRVRVPTLVLHRRDDRTVALAAARNMAAEIPGSRLKILEGQANLPFYEDATSVLTELESFLSPAASRLSLREQEVLQHLEGGHSNRTIAAALSISENTVARHLANIFLKLEVGSRTAAIRRGRTLGLLK